MLQIEERVPERVGREWPRTVALALESLALASGVAKDIEYIYAQVWEMYVSANKEKAKNEKGRNNSNHNNYNDIQLEIVTI